jgi:hypothetical protein
MTMQTIGVAVIEEAWQKKLGLVPPSTELQVLLGALAAQN